MSRRHGGHMASMFKEKKKTRSTKHLLKIFLSYLGDLKKQLYLVSLAIVLYTLIFTLQPIILQKLIDTVVADSSHFGLLIAAYFVLSILVWVFQSITTWLTAILSTSFVDRLRRSTFENLIDADMSYHHKEQSGNITNRVIGDTTEVATGLSVVTNLSSQLLTIISMLIVLGSISIYFVGIALLSVPVAMVVTGVIGTIGKKRMLKVRQASGRTSGKLAEALSGVAIAKSFNQEARASKEIKELNDLSYNYMKQLVKVFISVFPVIGFISTLLVVSVLSLGGYLAASGMTIGEIYLATILVQRFINPIIQLSNNFTQLQASLAALDRIVDVLEAKPGIKDSENAVPLVIKDASIELQNVSFAYKKKELVLKDISFTIPSGKKVALVGHTGSGKTTITNLIMRFYDPIKGSILIDGQDLRNVTLESVYDAIGIVTQEPYLFADTVLENIRYGKLSATDEEIYAICELIGADQFINALPNGYETVLQESGKALSAGQRQMITIARTMLSDPKILILDEATSRLDAISENLVQRAQAKLFKNRTTLIIAHRLSTIRDVDKIVVIDHGELIEEGTHDELYSKNGKYTELYNTYYSHQGLDD